MRFRAEHGVRIGGDRIGDQRDLGAGLAQRGIEPRAGLTGTSEQDDASGGLTHARAAA
jgi:hypothetical protein